jgi:hypothetical protein
MQADFEKIEKDLENLAYEEFFKVMNDKSHELKEMQEHHMNIQRNTQNMEQTMTLAVYIDKVKISDFGSVQFVQASEYKTKPNRESCNPN